jgi:hypothetical protein
LSWPFGFASTFRVWLPLELADLAPGAAAVLLSLVVVEFELEGEELLLPQATRASEARRRTRTDATFFIEILSWEGSRRDCSRIGPRRSRFSGR